MLQVFALEMRANDEQAETKDRHHKITEIFNRNLLAWTKYA